MKKLFPARTGVFVAECAAGRNSLAPDSKKSWPHRLFQLCCRGCSLPQRDYSEQLGWAASLAAVCSTVVVWFCPKFKDEGVLACNIPAPALSVVYRWCRRKSEGSSQMWTKNSPETGANRDGYVEEESHLSCVLNLTFSWDRWGRIPAFKNVFMNVWHYLHDERL